MGQGPLVFKPWPLCFSFAGITRAESSMTRAESSMLQKEPEGGVWWVGFPPMLTKETLCGPAVSGSQQMLMPGLFLPFCS